MKTRLVFDARIWDRLDDHLRQVSPREDGAFLLVRAGHGRISRRIVVHDLLLPGASAWDSQGQHNLRPSGQWLSAAIGEAIESDSGLAFVHSHPSTNHPSELSWIDQETSKTWARSIVPTLDRPFLSLVWTPTDISGWFFETADAEPDLIDTVEALGLRKRRVLHRVGQAPDKDEAIDDRQRRALGLPLNKSVRELSVAIVGLGGTGSPLAEILARMGVAGMTLIDPDVIDTPSNLRRISGSVLDDLAAQTPKAAVAARHLNDLHLVERLEGIQGDVRVEEVARTLIDADLVVSTTDTHSSRALVNQIAVQYYVPVIDVGVRVGIATDCSISGMPVDIRILLPDEACLWCRGILDASRIRAENLPPEEHDRLVAEGYVQGVAGPQPSLAALNYFAAAATATATLHLSADQPASEVWYVLDPWEIYAQPLATEIDPSCVCARWRGRADEEQPMFLSDFSAEASTTR